MAYLVQWSKNDIGKKITNHSKNSKHNDIISCKFSKIATQKTMMIWFIILLIAIGLFAGFFSGVVGIGGGVIMIPLFIFLLGFNQHQAQGFSLAVMLLPITFLAVIQYYKKEKICWRRVCFIGLFFILGGYIGAKISVEIDTATLSKCFGGFLIIIALRTLFSKKSS